LGATVLSQLCGRRERLLSREFGSEADRLVMDDRRPLCPHILAWTRAGGVPPSGTSPVSTASGGVDPDPPGLSGRRSNFDPYTGKSHQTRLAYASNSGELAVTGQTHKNAQAIQKKSQKHCMFGYRTDTVLQTNGLTT
jgi:hypothetical protein